MRSGAGVDALGDYAINPLVAESQMIMERSLEEVNRAWIAVQKGYFGDKKFVCYLGLGGSLKTVSYVIGRYNLRSYFYRTFRTPEDLEAAQFASAQTWSGNKRRNVAGIVAYEDATSGRKLRHDKTAALSGRDCAPGPVEDFKKADVFVRVRGVVPATIV